MANVLVDRHHAGLFHSLQLLGDRLDWNIFTPLGYSWWDEGYWRFGQGFGDARLARQFLTYSDWSPLIGGYFVTEDPEFPDRFIDGVTLSEARYEDWDLVVATVPDNQQGFARFAREHGAKFVVHVGNTNQFIDWSLDPLVLNASEMPIRGRGVNIGEEFDSDGIFAYRPPTGARRIGSFVNCMPSIACWPLLRAAMTDLAPEFEFAIHGIDGPDGNVKPITATADIMAGCDWGWHDKAHGDGFGHVIHYWAAIGRPLIGHGSHYRGKVAEKFWRDGETCIDLDHHSFGEAMDLVRGMSAERHEAMCRAIRRVFDETTDWSADADRVRRLLA